MTAIENTWGHSENLIFLGEWCKRYVKQHIYGDRNYVTIGFHWDDRAKLARDYEYLERLHNLVLEALVNALNTIHQVRYDKRYWQILLDPWLLSYIGIIFDRWECLRIAFETKKQVKVIFHPSESNPRPFYSHEDFVQAAAYSDEWNQLIYQRIIRFEHLENCVIENKDILGCSNHKDRPKYLLTKLLVLYQTLAYIYSVIFRFLNSVNVVLLGASFNTYSRIKLFISMGLFPYYDPLFLFRPHGDQFLSTHQNEVKRNNIRVDFIALSRFERYLRNSIRLDIPICLIEDYEKLHQRINQIQLAPKAIFTASAHTCDYFAKMWIAKMVSNGTKFFILEHGGSLPPFKEFFNSEPNISDVKFTWFSPYHPKHKQMPPPKILSGEGNLYPKIHNLLRRRKFCTLIGNECARWVHRAHFYPMANQWSVSFQMTLELHKHLNKEVQGYFKVKPYLSNQGWNTYDRYKEFFGVDKVYKSRRIFSVFYRSKVIICSYPETTFSEAMSTGIPTILMFPEKFYELNPVTYSLVKKLKQAKILFNDAVEAAEHINSIWDDPNEWWESPLVISAREEFYHQALNLKPGGLRKWIDFFKSTYSHVE